MTGSTIHNLSLKAIRNTPIKIPLNESEQGLIAKGIDLLSQTFSDDNRYLGKLRSLKAGLMQDLLTAKVRVTPLLEKEREAVTA